MLKLWANAPINNKYVFYIDSEFMHAAKAEWFNEFAIEAIENIDGNKYITNGISDSPIFGPIPPSELSGGVKTIIFAINNPDVVCPLEWLGDNCADTLYSISQKCDMTFTYAGYGFMFNPNQKIFCMEKQREVTGLREYYQYLVDEGLYESTKCGLILDGI